MNKKILIVTHWFYPYNVPRAFRSTAISKKLYDKGYNVDVINLNAKSSINMSEYTEINNSSSINNKFKSKYYSKLNNIFEFFFGERFYYTRKGFFKNIDIKDYDVIISIGLPFYVHRIVSKKIRKTKWKGTSISDWSDPYFNSHVSLAFYFKFLQLKVMKSFDYIVIPVKEAKPYYLNFCDEKKIRIIPQGFYINDIKIDEFEKNAIANFAYAGIFYNKIRNPDKLLKTLSEISLDFRFHLYTLTKGEIYEDVILKYKMILKEKLVIHDMLDRELLIGELSKMDFLINLENTTKNQVPSKLIDYSITKRPIVSLEPLMKKNDRRKLMDFLTGDYKDNVVIDLQQYDIDNVINQFIDLFGNQNEN